MVKLKVKFKLTKLGWDLLWKVLNYGSPEWIVTKKLQNIFIFVKKLILITSLMIKIILIVMTLKILMRILILIRMKVVKILTVKMTRKISLMMKRLMMGMSLL